MAAQNVFEIGDNYRFKLWKQLEMGELNLTAEQEKVCREYLDAWDKWSHAASAYSRNIKWPVPLVMLGFPIWVTYLILGDRHCGKLWNELDAKQKRWEDCRVAESRGTDAATC